MPKPVKKPTKRPSSDPNRRAHQMMAEMDAKQASGAAAPESFEAQLKAHMSKLGAKGGKVSGARRMTNLSDEQRGAIALKAARARWAKAKQAKKR